MEDTILIQKRAKELYNKAIFTKVAFFMDFMNLYEQSIIKSTIDNRNLTFFGGYDYAERQMVAIHSDALTLYEDFPIDIILIESKAPKFAQKLLHKDYLGAVLNLGLKRDVIGDILVTEKSKAYLFCSKKISYYILDNLDQIKGTKVKTSLIFELPDDIKPRLKEVFGTVASDRLDLLISFAFNLSRSETKILITKEQAFVNGKLISDSSFRPKPKDIVSVRKYGRFIFNGASGLSKKDKLKITISKYI